MSGLGFHLTRNDVSPALSKLAATARHPAPVFRAMGTVFLSITMGTFNDAGADYRPKVWVPKKDGTPSKLQKSGTLSRSFHLAVTDKNATVSNPCIYAATHQFGRTEGRGSPIPARPFFPVVDGKLTDRAAEKIRLAGLRAIERQV
ncbi:MAG: phage virion morphogenesis protein [Verrucomicrobiota bacterium]|jgi:phage gpG-like protein